MLWPSPHLPSRSGMRVTMTTLLAHPLHPLAAERIPTYISLCVSLSLCLFLFLSPCNHPRREGERSWPSGGEDDHDHTQPLPNKRMACCQHGRGGVFGNPRQGIGKVWLWPMAALFQKEGWKVTMTSALLLLRS